MKKNKLFFTIVIIIPIFFFTTAAICNQCQMQNIEEPIENKAAQEEDNVIENSEAAFIDKEIKETSPETQELKVPSIKLIIYEGPNYMPADNICYYKIEAIVSGNPVPDIVFSKDDSGGNLGERKTQVNLTGSSEIYTLTAEAINSVGKDSDSIQLSWECEINSPPEISDINFPLHMTPGNQYEIEAIAFDPDGDILSYSWEVSGGSLNDANANPAIWTAPGSEGIYNLKVTVYDGKGGQAIKTETANIMFIQLNSIELTLQTDKSGFISSRPSTYVGTIYRIGDDMDNYCYKAFLSFDISQLSGATIESAQLKASSYTQEGDLLNFKPLMLMSSEWHGQVPGFNQSGQPITALTHYNFICTAPELKQRLQADVDNNKNIFQAILFFTGNASDNDNTADMWHYRNIDIHFNVEYSK